ncbi:DUF4194 domain-containing protein, partial [Dermatophilus congolensis]
HRLFPTDTGRLPLHGRRALILILKNTHLDSRRHPEEWAALLDNQTTITSTLADLFLELTINTDTGIAYKHQAHYEGDSNSYTLLRNNPLTPNEIRLLLHLRLLLLQYEAEGRTTYTTTGPDLLTHLATQRPHNTPDHTRERERDKATIRNLIRDGILQPQRGQTTLDIEDAEYTISPIVETLLTPERITEYTNALTNDTTPHTGDTDE